MTRISEKDIKNFDFFSERGGVLKTKSRAPSTKTIVLKTEMQKIKEKEKKVKR